MVAVLFATTSWADKKIVDMTPGFERELGACEMQQGGIDSMLAKARAFVPAAADKAEIDKAIEALAKGQPAVAAYCAAVKDLVAFLKDKKDADYKAVGKEIDERDANVRKLRRDGKKAIEELAPITRKLIPKVTARVPQIGERKSSAKFPSGRIVDLPILTGSWKLGGNAVTDVADYSTDGVTATVTSRPFSNATCDQQRKLFASKAGDEPIADLGLSQPAKDLNVAWAWRYVRRDQTPHMLTMMCVPVGTGGFVAIADITPSGELATADEMTKLMVTMLALQIKPAPATLPSPSPSPSPAVPAQKPTPPKKAG